MSPTPACCCCCKCMPHRVCRCSTCKCQAAPGTCPACGSLCACHITCCTAPTWAAHMLNLHSLTCRCHWRCGQACGKPAAATRKARTRSRAGCRPWAISPGGSGHLRGCKPERLLVPETESAVLSLHTFRTHQVSCGTRAALQHETAAQHQLSTVGAWLPTFQDGRG